MLIYDCSNSAASLKNKTHLYGPKENDIIRYLKQYSNEFGHSFVNNPDIADVIITNDIFPSTFFGKRKVKRMDGVFCRKDLIHRNESLNQAAREADHVIFISNFAKENYFRLYDKERKTIKSYSIIPNEADPRVFYPGLDWSSSTGLKEVVSIASDWSRPEKRLKELLVLVEISPDIEFVLVGKVPNKKVPRNVRIKGYIDSPQELANILRMSDAMISLFYKDACPKTMVQAKCCGLPVLFTDSGGQPEIKAVGTIVQDLIWSVDNWAIDKEVPPLDLDKLKNSWELFAFHFEALKKVAMEYRGRTDFVKMLRGYFNAMEGVK